MLTELNLRPDRRQLRQFGFIALAAFGILGAVVLFRGGLFGIDFGSWKRAVAFTLWGVGGLSALFSLVWPRANQPLFTVLSVAAFPIGWVVSHVTLAVLFFGVLTPIALVFRLVGRDPLSRAWERDKDSYWLDLPEPESKDDYFRQF